MKLCIALASLAAALAAPAAATAPDSAALAKVDTIFADWQRASHVPGLVYGIVADGRLVAVHGLGHAGHGVSYAPVTADSPVPHCVHVEGLHRASAILKLRDEGKLSLDAPAETYVPELEGDGPIRPQTARGSRSATCSRTAPASSRTIRGATASR